MEITTIKTAHGTDVTIIDVTDVDQYRLVRSAYDFSSPQGNGPFALSAWHLDE